MTPGYVKESLPLIRKFNRHSELILKSITYQETHVRSKGQEKEPDYSHIVEKETELEDLDTIAKPNPIPLTINNMSNYYEGHTDVRESKRQKMSFEGSIDIKNVR